MNEDITTIPSILCQHCGEPLNLSLMNSNNQTYFLAEPCSCQKNKVHVVKCPHCKKTLQPIHTEFAEHKVIQYFIPCDCLQGKEKDKFYGHPKKIYCKKCHTQLGGTCESLGKDKGFKIMVDPCHQCGSQETTTVFDTKNVSALWDELLQALACKEPLKEKVPEEWRPEQLTMASITCQHCGKRMEAIDVTTLEDTTRQYLVKSCECEVKDPQPTVWPWPNKEHPPWTICSEYQSLKKEDIDNVKKQLEQILSTDQEPPKNDAGKIRWDLLPIEPLEEIIKVFQAGLKHYPEDSWKKKPFFSNKRVYSAMMRHLTAWKKGQMKDPGENYEVYHLAQVTWYCITWLWHELGKHKGGFLPENKILCLHKFQSPACGYHGERASCNKTFSRCQELHNEHRFGGFPAAIKAFGWPAIIKSKVNHSYLNVRCPLIFKDPKCKYRGLETSCDKTQKTCQLLGNWKNFKSDLSYLPIKGGDAYEVKIMS